ncbi:NAD binding domain of 6-phosphogluconate dehydrogenase-domain-containing protein [Piptocephalis cylindrospora]|uniref:NAD binding domain of 6-phosphogluconate dehydrogenase-domain-containing protein n=1 Tax=Piptocephalis cylindrospora TaxID=1907219 RepID=A0A4P9Y260_9FUNG|nr:NAD binding domain of 6-phosphogluconate dehydrogenase-domain-containing protein [Piptocephalis cylindrospora]|eukprot:RKP12764.1 NAD binding domain of 6-phosphogluconate dehydrogenase-domain-containing protein [Piptocephalis cylindrospora]
MSTERIGWIGLGQMGMGMAKCLQKKVADSSESIPPLTVYNRTASKCEELVELGAKATTSIQDLVEHCDIILTSLSNDAAVQAVYAELFMSLPKDRSILLVETSTVYPALTGTLAKRATDAGHTFVSAPVFGPPSAAANANLVLVLAGPEDSCAKLESLLVPTIARSALRLGEDPDAGSKMKLIGNFFVLGFIELLAEGLTLGQASGIGQEAVYRFIEAFMPLPTLKLYGERQMKDSFVANASFPIELSLKDTNHVHALAQEHHAAIPTLDAMREHLQTMRDAGHSDWDHSAVIGAVRTKANLPMILNDKVRADVDRTEKKEEK